MALSECPECGGKISTLAAVCPHCGFPVSGAAVEVPLRPRGPSRWTDPGFWVILVGLAAVIIISILLLREAADHEDGGPTSPSSTSEAAWVMPGED